MFKLSTTIAVLAAAVATLAAPTIVARQGSALASNALEAQKMNARFASLKATDSCDSGAMACIDGGFSQCLAGKWIRQGCANGTRCYALPLESGQGTTITCDTEAGANARFTRAGVTGGTRGDGSAPLPSPPSTPAPPSDDDEDLPFCDEDEVDDDNEVRDVPEDSIYRYFYRRQFDAGPVPPVVSSTVDPVPNPTSDAVITPTVVIGSDGIVTVTVVSTVFAAATDCAPAPSSSVTPPVVVPSASPLPSSSAAPIPVSSAVPSIPASDIVPPSSSAIPSSSAFASSSTLDIPPAEPTPTRGFDFTS